MSRYQLVVFSNPVAGQEQDFDTWYTNTHVRDLLKVPGIRSAQRHRVLTDLSRNALAGFVAEYEIESADITATTGEVRRRLGTDQMPMSDAFDRTSSSFIVLEPVTPLLRSETAADPAATVRAVSFVCSKSVPGREADFAAWYDGTHIGDLLRVPGYRQGQRFKVLEDLSRNAKHKFIARYEIYTTDLAATMGTARSRLGTPEMAMSDSFDMASASFNLTSPITERLEAAA